MSTAQRSMSNHIPVKTKSYASRSPRLKPKAGAAVNRRRHLSSGTKSPQHKTTTNLSRTRHKSSDSVAANIPKHTHLYGSKRLDLQHENAELKSKMKILVADYEERLRLIESSLSDTQEKYANMENTMTEKENKFSETVAELKRKNESLEKDLADYRKKMVLLSIDPVTLKPLKQYESQAFSVEGRRLQAKDKVEKFREHLKAINSQTSSQIQELKNLRQQLDRKK